MSHSSGYNPLPKWVDPYAFTVNEAMTSRWGGNMTQATFDSQVVNLANSNLAQVPTLRRYANGLINPADYTNITKLTTIFKNQCNLIITPNLKHTVKVYNEAGYTTAEAKTSIIAGQDQILDKSKVYTVTSTYGSGVYQYYRYAALPAYPFVPGTNVKAEGTTPSAFDGTYSVVASTTTQTAVNGPNKNPVWTASGGTIKYDPWLNPTYGAKWYLQWLNDYNIVQAAWKYCDIPAPDTGC